MTFCVAYELPIDFSANYVNIRTSYITFENNQKLYNLCFGNFPTLKLRSAMDHASDDVKILVNDIKWSHTINVANKTFFWACSKALSNNLCF